MANINLQQGNDSFIWSLHKTGLFTINSMYNYLINNGLKVSQVVWQLMIPLKFKIFIWFFRRGAILTKKTWHRGIGTEIGFVVFKQTHLFFECSRVMFLWRAIHMVLEINPPRN